MATTLAKRSVRSLSAGLRRSRRCLYVASGTMRRIIARCSAASTETCRAPFRSVDFGKPRATTGFNSRRERTGAPKMRAPPQEHLRHAVVPNIGIIIPQIHRSADTALGILLAAPLLTPRRTDGALVVC